MYPSIVVDWQGRGFDCRRDNGFFSLPNPSIRTMALGFIQPNKKKTPWSESAKELYRPSDRRLSAK
jgi:hypothetical protein